MAESDASNKADIGTDAMEVFRMLEDGDGDGIIAILAAHPVTVPAVNYYTIHVVDCGIIHTIPKHRTAASYRIVQRTALHGAVYLQYITV